MASSRGTAGERSSARIAAARKSSNAPLALSVSPDDKHYEAKVTVLSEQITHHVKEEEQRLEGMFSQARKEELICGYKAEGLPPPQTVTFIEAAV